jgi:Ni/Fe-hydrogenase subunit HybB-like protein
VLSADRQYRVIAPGEDDASLTRTIGNIVLRRHTPFGWWIGYLISSALFVLLVVSLAWLSLRGVGVWGNNIPVAWGFPIANYVWWIGLASGGTIISALFLLTRSEWRSATNRIAESMMLFCAASAGIMPIFHLGRFWYFYWLFPYPNVMGVWPQFRSPLHWDFVALFTYVVGSVLFWYVGVIPDLATMRDRSTRRPARLLYGIFALGWQGSSRQWRHFRAAYLVFAGIMAPVVVSIHSIVGLDFAAGMTPGWHSTQFPPYFVFGALLSSFGLILMLIIPLRRAYRLEALITPYHLDVLSRLLLTTSLLIGYAYAIEAFMPFYSGNRAEIAFTLYAFTGRDAFAYWGKIALNLVIPQLLWFRRVRLSEPALFLVSLGAVIGMWLERYLIVIGSLSRDYMASRWGQFTPTFWDWATLAGTIGLFLTGFFLVLRFVPIVSIHEMKELAHRHAGEAR